MYLQRYEKDYLITFSIPNFRNFSSPEYRLSQYKVHTTNLTPQYAIDRKMSIFIKRGHKQNIL